MATNKKTKGSVLSIIEAVETLSSIADMDFERDEAFETGEIALEEKEPLYRRVHWLTEDDREETIEVVKETFSVVLDYLRNYYREKYNALNEQNTLEGIKTIMVLVGEAAKRIDKCSSIFYQAKEVASVTESDEFKELQKFYQSRISHKVDEGLMGKWILGIAGQADEEIYIAESRLKSQVDLKTSYLFVDLEAVKRDSEYELFYLRKEDGTRFFNPRLIRNMKLVSDFGNYFGDRMSEDPLIELAEWKDRCARASAVGLIRSLGARIERFFHDTARYRRGELVALVNSAMMALLLSCHRENGVENSPVKSCSDYFFDFQNFLWAALHSKEYQKYVVYPPRSTNRAAVTVIDTIHALCRGLFIHLRGYEEMVPVVQAFFREESAAKAELSELFSREYSAMQSRMKRHPNGPLVLTLGHLEEGLCKYFAPLRQENLPVPQYTLFYQERKAVNIRVASPTLQEFIHRVSIDELFYGFLRACEKDHVLRKHLLINLQDKTSWREVGRCKVLEGLSHIDKLKKHVEVVTLAMDTDFYHQLPPYGQESDANHFKENFYEMLTSDGGGYFFSDEMRRELFPDFAKGLMAALYRIFFGEKRRLSRSERLNFIELYYFFTLLKIIEVSRPDSFSFTCKDGIDVGGSLNIAFYILLQLMNGREMTPKDIDCIHYLLYIPALMVRERLMNGERFNRAMEAVKAVEGCRRELGEGNFSLIVEEAFGPLYEREILHAQLIPYHS